MAQSFSMIAYLASFRVSASQGIVMATRLCQRADKDAPDPVRRAKENLKRVCAKVEDENNGRKATRKAPKIRSSVATLGNAWRAMLSRIQAWTQTTEANPTESAEAQSILDEAMPKGTDFLMGDPTEQWLESKRRLAIVTSPENKDVVTRLAGAPFVNALRKAHHAAGVELGMTGEGTPSRDEQDYRPLVKELIEAIRDYALQVIAAAKDSGTADGARLNYLLEPIETHRLRPGSDSSEDEGEQDQSGNAPVTGTATSPASTSHTDAVRDATPANDAAQPASGERRVA